MNSSHNSSPAIVDQVLASGKRFVIRGDAGSGKTTLLQWLAVRAAAQDFPPELRKWDMLVPFFIRLRSCVTTGFPEPEKFPEQIARSLKGSVPTDWVRKLLRTGRGIVLIDGVDEMPKDKREDMRAFLAELVSVYPRAYYIISSRPTALKTESWPEWNEWIEKSDFTELVLQPMDMPQVDTLIDHWHDAVRDTSRDEEEQELLGSLPQRLKDLLRNPGRDPLRKLATSPLLCAMICALHKERLSNLPSGRVRLYEQCIDMLLTGRDEQREVPSLKDYPVLNDNQKLKLCQHFAYWLLDNGYTDVDKTEAEEVFEKRSELMRFEKPTSGADILSFYVDRTNLLREPVVGKIDFRHRTFQEYLAAQNAIEEGWLGVLQKHAADDSWRETIVLAAGIGRKKEREDLLRRLLKSSQNARNTTERTRKILTVALASLETATADELDSQVEQEVIEATAILMPPTSDEDARLIAKAGEPAVGLLSTYSGDENRSLAWCVNALAYIGSESALAAIEGLTRKYQITDQLHLKTLADAYSQSARYFDLERYKRRILSIAPIISLSPMEIERLNQHPSAKHLFLDVETADYPPKELIIEFDKIDSQKSLESINITINPTRRHIPLESSEFKVLANKFSLPLRSFTIRANYFTRVETKDIDGIETTYLNAGCNIDDSVIECFTGIENLSISGLAQDSLSPLLRHPNFSSVKKLDISVMYSEGFVLPKLDLLESLSIDWYSGDFDCATLTSNSKIRHLSIESIRVQNPHSILDLKNLETFTSYLRHQLPENIVNELVKRGVKVVEM